jgi:hypothetical protein
MQLQLVHESRLHNWRHASFQLFFRLHMEQENRRTNTRICVKHNMYPQRARDGRRRQAEAGDGQMRRPNSLASSYSGEGAVTQPGGAAFSGSRYRGESVAIRAWDLGFAIVDWPSDSGAKTNSNISSCV